MSSADPSLLDEDRETLLSSGSSGACQVLCYVPRCPRGISGHRGHSQQNVSLKMASVDAKTFLGCFFLFSVCCFVAAVAGCSGCISWANGEKGDTVTQLDVLRRRKFSVVLLWCFGAPCFHSGLAVDIRILDFASSSAVVFL